MQPKPMSRADIESEVMRAVEDAKNFIQTDIEEERLTAMRYFRGETALGEQEGRSKVVDTVVQDAVQAVKPVLMRAFMQTEKPVEYAPKREDQVQGAEQATEYAQWVFDKCGGYTALLGAFHDALVQKTGIMKVWWDASSEVDIDEYSNLTDEEITAMFQDAEMQGDQINVLEYSTREAQIPSPAGPQVIRLTDAKVARVKSGGQIKTKLVAPERFFWNDGATGLNDFYVLGHSEEMRVTDLVEMGFDFSDVSKLDTESEEEADFERGLHFNDDTNTNDPSMREVTLTEAYMRMDIEGTGVARLYRFFLGGSRYKLLDFDLADDVPFAIYEVDPLPHQMAGRSLADPIINDQDVGTSLLRGLIDGIHISNNPKTFYREGSVDVDALNNNEYGANIACDNPQGDILEANAPNSAPTALPAMEYNNKRIAEKTGVSEAAIGTNGDFLQAGATVAGVNAAVQGAQARVEYMARNLAEGHKRLFKLLLRLIRKHVKPGEFMRLSGSFVPVDPSGWSADMDVVANVGLGSGQKAERMAMLQAIIARQEGILQGYGPQNGLVSLTNYRNAQADLAAMAGVHNMGRYMQPMSPEIEGQLFAQAAQNAQPPQDPTAGIAMAENIRAQAKLQSDQMGYALEAKKAAMEDDRKRDEMEQDAILEALELLGKYGLQPQPQMTAPIRQLQAQPR